MSEELRQNESPVDHVVDDDKNKTTPKSRPAQLSDERLRQRDRIWNRLTQVVQLVSAVSLVAVGLQLLLTQRQIVQTNTWNRINITIQAFDPEYFRQIRDNLEVELARLGINYDRMGFSALSAEQVEKIWGDQNAIKACKVYLNYMEQFSAAVNYRAYDEELAYKMKVKIILKTVAVFLPLIERARHEGKDALVYIELTNLHGPWKQRYDVEHKQVGGGIAPMDP